MKVLKILFAAAALVMFLGTTTERADAKTYYSFGYYGPGVSFHVGRYPHYHYYGPYHYRPYYYRPHYYSYRPYYYRPYTYRRRYYSGSRRCSRWSRRCARNWGYRNRNYYGCMRYHRCR